MSLAGMSALAMRTDAVRVNVDEEHESPLPATYQLEQNYPNPFGSEATSRSVADAAPRGAGNPTTHIRYALPQYSKVKLDVFDILGRSVAVLVNESKPAGVHQARFEAREVADGVYFYRLQAGEFSETKKMILMR